MLVGVGVNIKTAPTVAEYETAALGDGATAEDFLDALQCALDAWRGADFCDVRDRWMELAIGVGSEITYQNRPAIMVGINDDGALILRSGEKYLTVWGDEISL